MFLDYYNVGGIERIINDLSCNIKNYKIDILSFVNKSGDRKVISLLNNNYRNFAIRNIFCLKKLRKYLKNNKYDIIHIHCYNSFGLIYAYIARKYVKKIIVHGHNSGIDKDKFKIKKIINLLIKNLFSKKEYIYIACTNDISKFCFKNKFVNIIPNAVDYSKFYFNKQDRLKYRKLFNIDDNDIVIGHIGRFEEQKNHEFLIEIFKKICEINDNYKLILIGEGTLLENIKNKVLEYNLLDKVIFLNNRYDINNLINMFDIYVFPSLYEGFPLTVLESQINGCLVIVSNRVSKNLKISNKLVFLPLENKDIWIKEITGKRNKKVVLNNKLDLKNYVEKINEIYF